MRLVLRWFVRLVLGFVALSLVLVLVFKYVPVPVTATMLLDPEVHERGLTRDWEPLSNIDRNMARAVIASEDGKFCTHDGFDREAIEKAMANNAKGGRIKGGSTISQQTAKNVFLWQDGGYFRKGLEAWFTLLIEQVWGKRRIMEVYLNVAETGLATYGVQAGAERYFQHGANRMTPTEAGRLAAALPQPKERAVSNPSGWVRRHGNTISARIGVVRRDGLDSCLY